jgi:hypothetical protein
MPTKFKVQTETLFTHHRIICTVGTTLRAIKPEGNGGDKIHFLFKFVPSNFGHDQVVFNLEE